MIIHLHRYTNLSQERFNCEFNGIVIQEPKSIMLIPNCLIFSSLIIMVQDSVLYLYRSELYNVHFFLHCIISNYSQTFVLIVLFLIHFSGHSGFSLFFSDLIGAKFKLNKTFNTRSF